MNHKADQHGLASKTKAPPKKKRGRKSIHLVEGDKPPRERRRAQIRLAQRAYQKRRNDSIECLQDRILQLERTLEHMSEAFISFTDILSQSRALYSHPEIANHLHKTVQICLSLTRHVDGGIHNGEQNTENRPRHQEDTTDSRGSISMPSPVHTRSPASAYNYPLHLYPFQPDQAAHMEVSAFAEQLRLVCLYQGLAKLSNPSTPLHVLRRPFRLLLSLMPRETIASFFAATLDARLSRKDPPNEFGEIPFFQVGGAGTHYPPRSTTTGFDKKINNDRAQIQPRWEIVPKPLSSFPTPVQDDLNGEWFDIQDLTGYLQERGVRLLTIPPREDDLDFSLGIDVIGLTAALASNAMCLGYSPGFKRSDVEAAVNASHWV